MATEGLYIIIYIYVWISTGLAEFYLYYWLRTELKKAKSKKGDKNEKSYEKDEYIEYGNSDKDVGVFA